MTSIVDLLNSGTLHDAMRAKYPERVASDGSIHATAKRAAFVTWYLQNPAPSDDPNNWSDAYKAEYHANYVPSH